MEALPLCFRIHERGPLHKSFKKRYKNALTSIEKSSASLISSIRCLRHEHLQTYDSSPLANDAVPARLPDHDRLFFSTADSGMVVFRHYWGRHVQRRWAGLWELHLDVHRDGTHHPRSLLWVLGDSLSNQAFYTHLGPVSDSPN